MKQTFPERLKELREQSNITQNKLAKIIGVSARAIGFWEDGINEPKLSYIVSLAKFFGVSAGYLICLED